MTSQAMVGVETVACQGSRNCRGGQRKEPGNVEDLNLQADRQDVKLADALSRHSDLNGLRHLAPARMGIIVTRGATGGSG